MFAALSDVADLSANRAATSKTMPTLKPSASINTIEVMIIIDDPLFIVDGSTNAYYYYASFIKSEGHHLVTPLHINCNFC
jgi:hypothetical protein